MDFKALRAAKNKKAEDRINSSGGKVDASTWTPSEPLDADAKTGARPISRRAFKTGGMVDGDDAKGNLSRAGRKPSTPDGIQNRDMKEANEERDGKKHVGGFKTGGRTGKMGGGLMSNDPNYKKYNSAKLDAVGPDEGGEASEPNPSGLEPSKRQNARGQAALEEETRREGDMTRRKAGGMVKKYEGSPKDNLTDARMAKKKGMTHAEWEKSPEDKRMDAKGQREMDSRKDGGHVKGCMCKACGGSAGYKDGGGLYANINAKRERGEKMREPGEKGAPTDKAFKESAKSCADGCSCSKCRTARASGGRTKGKTNIVINVMPHTAAKPPMPPMGMPPVAAPPPMGGMPPPGPMHMPPGLGAAMAGAAGAPPMPPPGAPPGMPMPMARKAGGKVYPITTGSGGAKARLDKIKAYGLKQK